MGLLIFMTALLCLSMLGVVFFTKTFLAIAAVVALFMPKVATELFLEDRDRSVCGLIFIWAVGTLIASILTLMVR